MSSAILALVAALAPFASTTALAQVSETFADWQAACHPDGYCAALTDPAADHVLRIGRHAEEIWWEVSLTTASSAADLALPVTILVDGTPEEFTGPADVGAYGSEADVFFLGDGIQSVMDRLPSATALTVSYTGSDATAHEAGFSLDGLNAALIWIDEQQNRLGSERVAEAPPIGLAPVGANAGGEIAVADLPPELVAQHEARPDACDPFDILAADAQLHDLGDGKRLYLVPCTDGAYQTFYSAYVADKYGYTLQTFADFQFDGGIATADGVWQAGFDPATLTLQSYHLGRSAGDCGSRADYIWESNRFVLIRATAKPDCDATGEPGEFPVIYERPAKPAN